jgi:hypothetical protein
MTSIAFAGLTAAGKTTQGGQALAPGEERDVVSGLMQAGGEQGAGDPGAVHEQLHGDPSSYVRFSHTFV